ncbi:Maintenance of mitochondrial morphology protein 1 [Amanita muscaria]
MTSGNYIFSLQPTFTQGLIIGQFSILILLGLILKYLFLDSTQQPFERSSYHPQTQKLTSPLETYELQGDAAGSPEWLNLLLRQIADVYRSKLRDDMPGANGDEVARKRVENYANSIRPAGWLDHVKVHSVDLGQSAPRLSNARSKSLQANNLIENEFDIVYTDSLSVSFSTSYLFNYPMPSFARLPVSLTISLSQFKSSVTVTPPSPTSTIPVLTIKISPNFQLDVTTTSLMGSRAKLANVPKLHELIQHQVRRLLAARGTWKVVLPGLSSVSAAQDEIENEILNGEIPST